MSEWILRILDVMAAIVTVAGGVTGLVRTARRRRASRQ